MELFKYVRSISDSTWPVTVFLIVIYDLLPKKIFKFRAIHPVFEELGMLPTFGSMKSLHSKPPL